MSLVLNSYCFSNMNRLTVLKTHVVTSWEVGTDIIRTITEHYVQNASGNYVTETIIILNSLHVDLFHLPTLTHSSFIH